MDFARTELEKPRCFYCDINQGFEIIKKQELSPKVMVARLKLSTDRVVDNLKKAYFVGKQEDDKFNEEKLIKILAKANKLRHKVQSLKFNKKDN